MKRRFSPHFFKGKNAFPGPSPNPTPNPTPNPFLNYLANKQLRSTNTLYSVINGSAMDYEQLLVNIEILT